MLPHERVLFGRGWLTREIGEGLSPVQAACWLDFGPTSVDGWLSRVVGLALAR